jgi:DNA-binding transcriptional ArsR family regulator
VSIAVLDPLIHPPKRLAAMAILAASDWADFTFLRDRLDASDSDLSKQMKVLQDAGYVKVDKRGRGRGSSTWYRLTREGRHAFEAHVAFLRALVASAPVSPDGPPPQQPAPAGEPTSTDTNWT